MDLGLRDAVCLVTGASAGIGRAIAAAFAREGARVAIAARNAAPLDAAAAAIRKETGAVVEPFVADVTDSSSVALLVSQTRKKLGDPRVVVANAGGPPPGDFSDLSWEKWTDGFARVVGPQVHLVWHALPHMLPPHRGGCFISIQSTSVRQPIEGLLLSNALRPSVVGLYKSLALQHAPHGVRFHVVGPGSTRTDRILEVGRRRVGPNATDEEALAAMAKASPMGRLLEPDEIASAVVFLASDRASGMTGCFVPVDGGAIRAL